ncbi:unnamed protein product [Protopolystoma xenopodis]|uniref:Uncharacterized protein n=1 Tax=Protopolystoma xenopodis TaxID=117903 RepID=A0A3S5AB69_9PLAT|nr:unnamed protein product [Protopolystoma xenopodis]
MWKKCGPILWTIYHQSAKLFCTPFAGHKFIHVANQLTVPLVSVTFLAANGGGVLRPCLKANRLSQSRRKNRNRHTGFVHIRPVYKAVSTWRQDCLKPVRV